MAENKTVFNILNSIILDGLIEKKDNGTGQQLDYLSWADAWELTCKMYPDSTYEVIKNDKGYPYFESECGAMVFTKVTIENKTLEMWLPVMNSSNKAMKKEPYEYTTKKGNKTVEAYTMFDINKTIMRCLVKNLAMFGLGIHIYKKEDLPNVEDVKMIEILSEEQILELENLIIQSKKDRNKLMQFWKITDLKNADYQKCKTQLLNTIEKEKGKDNGNN